MPVPNLDRLASQARRRGISIAALLEELSDQAERHAAFEAERMATLDDAERSQVQSENLDWDATASDAIE